MYNFFVNKNSILNGKCTIDGADFNHIKNVLRLNVGDEILISYEEKNSLCQIKEFSLDSVIVEIIEEEYSDTSLAIDIYLFQGLPKSDKLELIIQKAVELGVKKVTPVEMNRSIVKIEEKKKESKRQRWQSIAESAAKQCKRSFIPTVDSPITYKKALDVCKTLDLVIVPYENAKGMLATKEVLAQLKPNIKVGVIIGPEGGFDQEEINLALNLNAKTVSLGKRILRTETAAITAISMLMLYAEMNF